MPRQPQEPVLFTLDEADRLIPKIRQMLYSLRAHRDRIVKWEEKKAVEELSWLQEDGTVSPKAQREVARLEALQQKEAVLFEKGLKEFHATGAELKDLNEGLVDFYTRRGDEVVYLCWKDGEDQILYWHDFSSGAAGRRPIAEL